MDKVAISPKYQIVIPQRIRQAMQLFPEQKVQVIMYGNRIELIPERDIKEMRGFLKCMSTDFEREKDRL